jgi:hypothetical protein
MNANELLTKLRYEDALDDALEGAVIAGGAGGASGGGASRGFVLTSEKPLAEMMPRIRELANEHAGEDVRVVYVKANI